MRKVEKAILDAVQLKQSVSVGNSRVAYVPETDRSEVFLHGNRIAVIGHGARCISLDSCGWRTATTRSRINALVQNLCSHSFLQQKAGRWILHTLIGRGTPNETRISRDFEDGDILELK